MVRMKDGKSYMAENLSHEEAQSLSIDLRGSCNGVVGLPIRDMNHHFIQVGIRNSAVSSFVFTTTKEEK